MEATVVQPSLEKEFLQVHSHTLILCTVGTMLNLIAQNGVGGM